MPTATRVTTVPREVVYAEKLIKRLADFYEVPTPKLVLHKRYPVRLSWIARWNLATRSIELAHPGNIEDTICHEWQHYLDDLTGYKEHHRNHSPGFYRRVAVTMEEARAARDL